jgi:glycosyltransferase involved in cell wall biosynthesis
MRDDDERPAPGRIHVAYVMSRFPKLTETFIVREILALEALGHRVDVFPLLRERMTIVQPGTAEIVARAAYLPFISRAILASQLYWLRRRPRAYLSLVRDIVRGAWGSPNFLVGGLAILPKVAHAARRIAAGRASHVHCHFANHPATAGLIIHRLTDLPFSFTAHGSDLHRDRHLLAEKAREAAFVVAISRYNADVIAEACGPWVRDRLHVIHCGVDVEAFRPAEARNEPRMAHRRFTICAIGTLHEVKGQAHLVEAVRRLAARGLDLTCTLIGDGPDRAMLAERIRSSGLAGTVELVGVLTADQVAARLRATDVLVAPSVPSADGRREGIPVVLMEAMASGVPVVASRLSGIPELVEDDVSGLLVEPGDADGLASAVARLHDDPALRRRLGERGRQVVLDSFDIRASAARLAAAIDAAASAGSHADAPAAIPAATGGRR